MTIKDHLPETLKDHVALTDFKDVGGLAQSFIDTQAKLGGMVTIPNGESAQADHDKFWNKLGRPETADGYEIEFPKIDGQIYEPATIASFKTAVHSLGLTGKQAQGVVNVLMANVTDQVKTATGKLTDTMKSADAILRADWGAKFESNMTAADQVIGRLFDEAGAPGMRQMARTDPAFARSMLLAAQQTSETGAGDNQNIGAKGGGGGEGTKEGAAAAIATIRNDPKHAYYDKKNPSHAEAVTKMSELYSVVAGEAVVR